MKKVFIKIFLLFGFSVLFCSILYSAEDNNKSQSQSSQVSDEKSSQTSEQTPPKSILPPVVPSPLPNVSPAPSPNISTPPIMPDTMDVQRINKINANNQLRSSQINIPALPKLPTLPPSTSVTKSVPSVPILPQKIQLIKSLLGTVVNIRSEKDGILWLDVKDRFSDETVRINVNSKKTRVIQKDAALALKDIKTGDMVRVIFNQAGKEIPVNVISIINEEDLKINAQPK
jgi:hypothetical protein